MRIIPESAVNYLTLYESISDAEPTNWESPSNYWSRPSLRHHRRLCRPVDCAAGTDGRRRTVRLHARTGSINKGNNLDEDPGSLVEHPASELQMFLRQDNASPLLSIQDELDIARF
jgi:hypothetical protein